MVRKNRASQKRGVQIGKRCEHDNELAAYPRTRGDDMRDACTKRRIRFCCVQTAFLFQSHKDRSGVPNIRLKQSGLARFCFRYALLDFPSRLKKRLLVEGVEAERSDGADVVFEFHLGLPHQCFLVFEDNDGTRSSARMTESPARTSSASPAFSFAHRASTSAFNATHARFTSGAYSPRTRRSVADAASFFTISPASPR